MVFAQLGLLYLCLLYRPGSFASSAFSVSSNDATGRDVLFDAEPPGSGVPREARTPTSAAQPQFQVRVDPPPEEADEEDVGHHAPSHIPQREDETASRRQQSSRPSNMNGVPSLSVNTLELPEIIESNRPFGFWTWPDFAS
mgnify:CR=1 FL=1|jgi:hypothetical protein